MSATIGKDGEVRIGSTVMAYMDTWSLNMTADVVEITAFGDTSKNRVQTFKDWTASMAGSLDRSDAQQAALLDQFEDGTLSEVQVRLYTDAGSSYWYGSAVLNSSAVGSSVSDKVTVSFDFQGSGALNFSP